MSQSGEVGGGLRKKSLVGACSERSEGSVSSEDGLVNESSGAGVVPDKVVEATTHVSPEEERERRTQILAGVPVNQGIRSEGPAAGVPLATVTNKSGAGVPGVQAGVPRTISREARAQGAQRGVANASSGQVGRVCRGDILRPMEVAGVPVVERAVLSTGSRSVPHSMLPSELRKWIVVMSWAWFGLKMSDDCRDLVTVLSLNELHTFLDRAKVAQCVILLPLRYWPVLAGAGRWVSHVASLRMYTSVLNGEWSVLWWGCGERGRNGIIHLSAPTLLECREFLRSSVMSKRLGLENSNDKDLFHITYPKPVTLPPIGAREAEEMYAKAFRSSFIVKEFIAVAPLIADRQLADRVIKGLTEGWGSGFRGRSFEFQNRSRELDPEDDQVLHDTLVGYRSKGYAIGPFPHRPPFPTPQFPDVQPIVHMAFTVPKERWSEDPRGGPQRMIVHGSTPVFESFNDLTPRADSGYPYHTSAGFLKKVARGGPGALVMLIDCCDWFMQLATPPREWARQCLQAKDEFWVVCVGMFGSVYAGDNSNCVAQFLCNVGREVYKIKGLDFYVDNFECVVPGLPDESPDWTTAHECWKSINSMMDRFGIRCHHRAPPARTIAAVPNSLTDVSSHLGWCCDVQRQMVFVPEKKRPIILRLVEQWSELKKFSLEDLESMCGFFLFLSLVLRFLKANVGVLMRLKSKASTSVSRLGWKRKARCLSSPRATTALKSLRFLLQEWDWSGRITAWDWRDGPDIIIHADAAIPKEKGLGYNSAQWGRGAWVVETKSEVGRWFYSDMWEVELIECAKRKKALSAPFLEFMNYTACIRLAGKLGFKRIAVLGDCKPAVGWLDSMWGSDSIIMDVLFDLSMEMSKGGFEFVITQVKREEIATADALSRNCVQVIQELRRTGLRRVTSPSLRAPKSQLW